MTALAGAIASGSMANLELLSLHSNQIGDDGMKALSSAIANGSLDKVEHVHLWGNPGSEAPVEAALSLAARKK